MPEEITLGVKETYALSVKNATFKSSKTSVATVSKKGVITAKRKGTAKITVMSGKKKVGTCTVTVVDAPKEVSLGMKEAAMGLKETLTLVPVITDKSHTTFTYTTKNNKIATVSTKGVITAKKVGSTTVTVKTHNGKTATLKLTVKKAPSKVTVKPKSLSLEVGQTANLTASVPNKTASFKLTWTSGNKKIATVDENGIVTAVKAGTAKITVKTFNNKEAVCTVTVTNPAPTQAVEQLATELGMTVEELASKSGKTIEELNAMSAEELAALKELVQHADFLMSNGVITGYTGKGGAIVLPAVDSNGNTITAIGEAAFKGNTTITSVTISAGITHIGESAFEGCSAIKDVTIPNGVTMIGKAAFKYCANLASMSTYD